MPDPAVSVVVASHGRADVLSTCLDALARQTLDRDQWELVVVHTYEPDVAERALDSHELARAGVLRHIGIPVESARPSTQRNVGWRAARAPLVAFTDDDCRAEEGWLEKLVKVARRYPGAIVQGATFPDPRDRAVHYATHVRTVYVEPPGRHTQTCNILYDRSTLERIGGFDERATTGEDIDLAIRAQEAGAELVGVWEAVVYHGVEKLTVSQKIRANRKWEHLVYVVRKHPQLRTEECTMRLWWKPEHLWAMVALGGVLAARRHPTLLAAATLPYFMNQRKRFPITSRGTLQALRRTPELWLVDVAEIGTFLRGSLRYRTLVL